MGNIPISGGTSGMPYGNYDVGYKVPKSVSLPMLFDYSDPDSVSCPKLFDMMEDANDRPPVWLLFGEPDYSSYGTHSHSGSSSSSSRKVSEKGKELLKNKEFMDKVVAVSKRIGCDFKDLLGVMRAESGLNPSAINKKSRATGLIQFMPKTAEGLGTSVYALENMSAVDQLDYVEEFLIRAKRSAGFSDGEKLSAGQLYALVFLPARAKRDVLTVKGEKFYDHNSATDTNHDGKITQAEMDARAKRFRADEYIPSEYLVQDGDRTEYLV